MNRAAWKLLFKVAFSLILLLYLFSKTDLGPLWGSVRQAYWPYLLLGLVMVLSIQFLSALKWKLLLKALGIESPFGLLVRCYFIGTFFNLFLPGLVGGDFARGYYLVKEEKETSTVVLSILAERLLGLVCLLMLTRGFLFFCELPGTLGRSVGPTLSLLLLVLLLLGSGLVFGGPVLRSVGGGLHNHRSSNQRSGIRDQGSGKSQEPLLTADPCRLIPAFGERSMRPWIPEKLRGLTSIGPLALLSRLLQDLSRFRHHPVLLGAAMLLIFGYQVIFVTVHILLGRSLGFDVPPVYYFIFVPLSTLLSALPISFSGLGVREGSYFYFLRLVQVPGAQALSFSLMWLSILLASGLVGGMVYLEDSRITAVLAARKRD